MSLIFSLAVFQPARVQFMTSHEESGEWDCKPDTESRVAAEFKPGFITPNGHADDSEDVYGFEFPLLSALDPDQENAYKDGKMTAKALHDGKDMYFLLQVDGDYWYSKGASEGMDNLMNIHIPT